LWPFSTLGWPGQTPDYQYFYPTTMMETGYDILFFWVARMIMDGLEFTSQVPFNTVYLHGLIRNEDGLKMSKSKGTGIDPLPVMDEYGTDALRFTLLVGSTPGNDLNLSLKKVEGNRNFANKVWNAGRFVVSAVNSLPEGASQASCDWTLADSWVWARLQALVREVERLFQSHQYGEAGRQIYEFFWSDFADWYVEAAKLQLSAGGERATQTARTLARVLDLSLRMLHPFTPFVTEELWGHLRRALLGSPLADLAADWPEALIIAPFPEPRAEEGWETARVEDFTLLQEIIRSIRNLRAERKVAPAKRIAAVISAGGKQTLLTEQAALIASLAGLDAAQLTIDSSPAAIGGASPGDLRGEAIALVVGSVTIHVPLAGMVDLDAERLRLEKELGATQAQMERLQSLLASDFTHKAPEVVVQKERERLATLEETAAKLKAQLG
jgi:valyl-tRNA synthetase